MSKSNSKPEESKHGLLLVDGSSVATRVFYALGGATLVDREDEVPVNDLVAFVQNTVRETVSNIQQKIKHEGFSGVRVALESPSPCFRYELYEDYKHAVTKPNKPRVAQALQKPLAVGLREAGIKIAYADGMEADDVIAIMVTLMEEQYPDPSIYIWSTDSDLEQLLTSPNIKLLGAKGKVTSMADVEKKWGKPATAIPLLKALIGDSSDNIPGMHGIGPHKAPQMIRYAPYRKMNPWTLDYANMEDELKRRVGQMAPRIVLDEHLCTLVRKGEVRNEYDAYIFDTGE